MINALKDGTIDCIATDHAPHNVEEKESDFIHASCGMTGLETAFSSSYTALKEHNFTIEDTINLFTSAPSKVMNIKKEFLKEGSNAEIVVLDQKENWSVSEDNFKSKSRNSAFIGETLTSRVKYTIFGKNCFINN